MSRSSGSRRAPRKAWPGRDDELRHSFPYRREQGKKMPIISTPVSTGEAEKPSAKDHNTILVDFYPKIHA